MSGNHKPLASHETVLILRAKIEGLRPEQLVVRDQFVQEGFSVEHATRIVSIPLSAEERNVARLEELMRSHGWAEDQVEEKTRKFLDAIDQKVQSAFGSKHS